LGQVSETILEMIEQAAGAGDDNFGTLPQRSYLVMLAHAAIDGDTAHRAVSAQIDDRLMNLFGELTGGCEDKGAHPSRWTFDQALQDGQHEGCGLAGAGLRQRNNVATLENDRYRFPLDWCR
jgi:hypothetical protein